MKHFTQKHWYKWTVVCSSDAELGPPKAIRFSEVTDTSATVHWMTPGAPVDSYLVTYVPAHGGQCFINTGYWFYWLRFTSKYTWTFIKTQGNFILVGFPICTWISRAAPLKGWCCPLVVNGRHVGSQRDREKNNNFLEHDRIFPFSSSIRIIMELNVKTKSNWKGQL